ncbi:MAG TPA: glutamate-cysteine ligase family protein [Kofleriaceae bacterium]|nr:glutamate-cysteine ligase family protein [Kofleriaceae bacterium]
MHLVDESDAVPVTSVGDLVDHFRTAEKPREQWRVGTEHELIGVRAQGPQAGTPPAYDGADGIGAVLAGFAARGWTPVQERGHVIALSHGAAQVTIEPGGQFELAARPVSHSCDLVADLREHVGTLAEVSLPMGLAWLSIGLRPFGGREDIPWMPKERYDVMRAYMPTVGTHGLDMMLRTATVQTNLDWSDEEDAAAKLRCLMSVTQLLTALWASSPILDGKVSGYQSYRAHIWRHTDNDRSGLLRFAFEDAPVYRAYVEWALDVPMYFVYRGGYRPVRGLTFRQFMANGWEGEHATRADWGLHLSTLFPDARMKKYMEVRGCDCGSLPMIAALAPFCHGLLYDETARAAAIALTAGLDWDARQTLADEVPKSGLATRVGKTTVGELSRELVAIARDGLRRTLPGVLRLIEPVAHIAETGRTQADEIIEMWNANAGNVEAQVRALAHPGLHPTTNTTSDLSC